MQKHLQETRTDLIKNYINSNNNNNNSNNNNKWFKIRKLKLRKRSEEFYIIAVVNI